MLERQENVLNRKALTSLGCWGLVAFLTYGVAFILAASMLTESPVRIVVGEIWSEPSLLFAAGFEQQSFSQFFAVPACIGICLAIGLFSSFGGDAWPKGDLAQAREILVQRFARPLFACYALFALLLLLAGAMLLLNVETNFVPGCIAIAIALIVLLWVYWRWSTVSDSANHIKRALTSWLICCLLVAVMLLGTFVFLALAANALGGNESASSYVAAMGALGGLLISPIFVEMTFRNR